MYFVFLENTKIVSNIGANSHNPNAKPVPFPKDSASINLLATDITNNMIHPKTGTSKSSNHHGLIPHIFNITIFLYIGINGAHAFL